jgi:hypothetical protein
MSSERTCQKIPVIERLDTPNCVQNTIKETKENNPKTKKIDQTLSQTPTYELKHDQIQEQWCSNILSKNMLEMI